MRGCSDGAGLPVGPSILNSYELGAGLFEEVNRHLESQGLHIREGTIVDASIIAAPSSTKNRSGARDPEMHRTKKGNAWRFGMKVHIGVDTETGVVHGVSTTAANAHDLTEVPRLLHGGESEVWADAGYRGVEKRPETRDLGVEWRVAMRPGRRRQLEPGSPERVFKKRVLNHLYAEGRMPVERLHEQKNLPQRPQRRRVASPRTFAARLAEGRAASPTAAVIDSHSVKTTEKGDLAATMPGRRSVGGSGTSS